MEIRDLQPQDLEAILKLEQKVFTDPWSADSFAETANDLRLVADEDGTVVGYLIGRVVFDQAELLNIAIDPSYRRRGFGRRLLDGFLTRSAHLGAASVFLEVRESNLTAQRMYAEIGFEAVGKRAAYYRSPSEDAVLMSYRLTGRF